MERRCLAVGKRRHHALGRVEARMDGDVELLYAHSSQTINRFTLFPLISYNYWTFLIARNAPPYLDIL